MSWRSAAGQTWHVCRSQVCVWWSWCSEFALYVVRSTLYVGAASAIFDRTLRRLLALQGEMRASLHSAALRSTYDERYVALRSRSATSATSFKAWRAGSER